MSLKESVIEKRKTSFIILAIAFIVSLWTTSQYFAYLTNYHKILGDGLFQVHTAVIYQPLSIISWYLKFYDFVPEIFLKSSDAFFWTFVAFFPIFIIIGLKEKKETVHGTAEWMTDEKDFKKAGLLCDSGVFLGIDDKGRYLRHNGPEHIIAIAPTRAGKGVSLIIPTLLAWEHSVIVMDIKGENYQNSSGFRQKILKQKVFRFAPTDIKKGSCKFNPIAEIRIGTSNEVSDAQNIAQIIIDPTGTAKKDHWTTSGTNFLVGAILHVCYMERLKGDTGSLGKLYKFLSGNESLDYILNTLMLNGEHVEEDSTLLTDLYKDWSGDPLTHPVVAAAAGEMLKKGDKEQAGIVSSAIINLSLYLDPVVNEYTSSSDFAITDLVSRDEKVSLYLIIPPSDRIRLAPLLRMIFSLVSSRLIGIMEYDANGNQIGNKNRLLLMLDEFATLGTLENLEQAFAFIAGYGLKAFIIVQTINQLKKYYGENNSIMDNCHIRIFFAPNDANTPDTIVKLLGTQTVEVTNKSWSGVRWLAQWSYSTNFQSRPLLTTGEILLLSPDMQIILVAGYKPLLTNKNLYYKDENFIIRKSIPPVLKSDTFKGDDNA